MTISQVNPRVSQQPTQLSRVNQPHLTMTAGYLAILSPDVAADAEPVSAAFKHPRRPGSNAEAAGQALSGMRALNCSSTASGIGRADDASFLFISPGSLARSAAVSTRFQYHHRSYASEASPRVRNARTFSAARSTRLHHGDLDRRTVRQLIVAHRDRQDERLAPVDGDRDRQRRATGWSATLDQEADAAPARTLGVTFRTTFLASAVDSARSIARAVTR